MLPSGYRFVRDADGTVGSEPHQRDDAGDEHGRQ
jgi:hypothetical protein